MLPEEPFRRALGSAKCATSSQSVGTWGRLMTRRVAWLLVGIGTFGHALDALGQTRTAREVYQAACAACHGSDGSGAPAAEAGYPLVPPDFRDCNFSTREPAADWVCSGPSRPSGACCNGC